MNDGLEKNGLNDLDGVEKNTEDVCENVSVNEEEKTEPSGCPAAGEDTAQEDTDKDGCDGNADLEEAQTPSEAEDDFDGQSLNEEICAVEGVVGEELDKKEVKKDNSFVRGVFEMLEMLTIAVAVVVLIITFFFRFSNVDGESMTYTINEKDTLLVSMAFYQPKKGDIVIFQAPDYDINKPLVKRVIATEGDSLEINFDTWEVKVNGEVVDEYYVRYHPYLSDGEDELYHQNYPEWDMDSQSIGGVDGGSYDPQSKIFTAVIPEGHVFAMGDNRNNSHDSRSANIGMVDERYIIGKVICRIFPFEEFGPLN